jgi:hypothetical protein
MVSFEAEAAAKGPGDLTLEPGEELRILLLDRESKPLADVSITGWISGPEGDSSQSITLGKTDKDGFVVWKQAPPRTTELQIQFYASKDKSSASQQWDKQSRNKEKNADVILQMGKQR